MDYSRCCVHLPLKNRDSRLDFVPYDMIVGGNCTTTNLYAQFDLRRIAYYK